MPSIDATTPSLGSGSEQVEGAVAEQASEAGRALPRSAKLSMIGRAMHAMRTKAGHLHQMQWPQRAFWEKLGPNKRVLFREVLHRYG